VRNYSFPTGTSGSAPPWLEVDLAARAARQHGVLRVPDLRDAGLNGSAVNRRVRRGALHRVHPGVYAYGHAALSRDGRWLAAVFAGGDGAVLSHLATATCILDQRRFRSELPEILIPRRHQPVPGIVIHTCRRLDPRDVTTCRGIPTTTVARMLVDLSDSLTPHQLAFLIKEAAYWKRFDLAATRRAMARANERRNLRVLERAIELYLSGSGGTKSPHEDALLALLDSASLPEPLVNVQLEGFEVDAHWPDLRLAVEVDGGGHERPTARRRDAELDRALQDAGYTVLRVTDADIARRPAEVMAEVKRARARAS
jgi:very-short-patch-repair endonuclease